MCSRSFQLDVLCLLLPCYPAPMPSPPRTPHTSMVVFSTCHLGTRHMCGFLAASLITAKGTGA